MEPRVCHIHHLKYRRPKCMTTAHVLKPCFSKIYLIQTRKWNI
jgi:hypothetical protein